jgi:diguanylate cyclase (GGDEF)-like protein
MDILCRLAGDEFVIMLPEVDSVQVPAIVKQRIITALQQPWEIKGQCLLITTSIGYALYSGTGELEDILKLADHAMYESKNSERFIYK